MLRMQTKQHSWAWAVSIEKLLNPQSIAIVGVSTKKATFQVGGRAIFDHLRKHGYPHRIDIVTRDPATIDGVESVTDLDALNHTPDCILISVPATEVYETIEKGLALGCRAYVTLTAGFSEAGEQGQKEQERIASLLKDNGAVMLGPNTTGFVNLGARVAMSSTSRVSAELSPAGNVGLVVQSGALGSGLLEEAARNLAGSVGLLAVVDRQREERQVARTAVDGRGHDHSLAVGNEHRARRLLGDPTGLEGEGAATDLTGDRDHVLVFRKSHFPLSAVCSDS